MRSRTPLKPLLEFVRLLYAIAKTEFISSRIITSLDFKSAVQYNYDSFHIYHFAHCFRLLPFQLPAFVDVFVLISSTCSLTRKFRIKRVDENQITKLTFRAFAIPIVTLTKDQCRNLRTVVMWPSSNRFGASIPRHILPFVTLSAY